MKFTKMHGCGNDYVYINCFQEDMSQVDVEELAIRLSDRHFGIGGDGIILIRPSKKADFQMEMHNADGSQAEMCGNGIRCVGKYVYDYGLTNKTEVTIETLAGIKILQLNVKDNKVESVRVDMGCPILNPKKVPILADGEEVVGMPVEVKGASYKMTAVSMGNPHGVIFIDEEVAEFPIEEIGSILECHSLFPKKANIEFVKVKSENEVDMRVWERGTGETLACGTGTCATVVASILNHKTANKVLVHLLGGNLEIEWSGKKEDSVFMTGPATKVFDGEIDL